MSITYFCTDSQGNTYTRFSAGHAKPQYFTAAISRKAGGGDGPVAKANVTYSKGQARGETYRGWSYEVVPVRAYEGRHKVEPVARTQSDPILDGIEADARNPGSVDYDPRTQPEAPAPVLCPTTQTYDELQRAYDYFNITLFNGALPPCLITLQRKGKRTLGYYSPDRFSRIDDASLKADEIALNPVHFVGRSLTDILATLVHEMVHLQCQHSGEPCRRGYHDKAWGRAMKDVGLHPSHTGMPGGRETGQQMDHYVIAHGPFAKACQGLIRGGFRLSYGDRHGEGEKAKSPKAGKRSKYVCIECELAAWARPEAHLMCADCGVVMDEQ